MYIYISDKQMCNENNNIQLTSHYHKIKPFRVLQDPHFMLNGRCPDILSYQILLPGLTAHAHINITSFFSL